MKKLMIAAAFACAAAFANAGCYTWGLSSGEDLTHNGGENYLVDVPFTVMLFTGNIGQTLNSDGKTYKLDFSGATYVTQTSKASNYTIGSFDYSESQGSPAVDGSSQSYAMLVLDTGANITDYAKYEGTYAIVSGTGALKQDKESGGLYTEFMSSAAVTGDMYNTASSGSPGPEPVPEPTSGLLLLIGVAGMALRRRV